MWMLVIGLLLASPGFYLGFLLILLAVKDHAKTLGEFFVEKTNYPVVLSIVVSFVLGAALMLRGYLQITFGV